MMKRLTHTSLIYAVAFLVLSFVTSGAHGDTLNVTNNITPAQMVQEVLIGGGVQTSNITFTGASISRGKFWGGPGNIGIREGIILTSGSINVAKGPNNQGNAGQGVNTSGDPDLNSISGVSTFDACVLEFDFVPQSNVVSFRYVFGSEEYHEYVNSYNDAFGFFISGPGITGPFSNNSKNIALIPLSTVPVTINTVNCGNPYNCQTSCTNCQFFVNNNQQFTQYDAFTTVLSAWANVIPCETYHIKLAIGDGVDDIYDSGVFLEANSFSSVGISNNMTFSQTSGTGLIEGCNDATILFTLSVQPDEDFYLPIIIEGTATNGVDYEELPDSVFFPQGYSQSYLDIVTIPDELTELLEYVRIVYNSSLCGIDYDTIQVNINDYKLGLQTTPDTTINCATNATIGIKNIIGYGPYTIQWSTGDTTPYISVSPLISTTYYVTVSALCDSLVTDSIRVDVEGPESSAGTDLSIPYGTTTQLQGSATQGSGDYTFSWEPSALLVDPNVATPTTLQMEQTTLFTLTVTDLAGGCQDQDQMMLFVTGGPLNAGPVASPPEICFGTSAQLHAYPSGGSENYTYSWTSTPPGFVSDQPNPIVQPDGTTTYHVMVSDGYNSVTANVTVTVLPLPVPDAGENDTIYHGTYTVLYGSGSEGTSNYSWHWEPADKLINAYAQNPITVKLYETTLFRLSITDLTTGCVSEGEDFVTVVIDGGPLAVTAESADNLICEGESTQLYALPSGGNPDYSFQWTSDPPGFNSIDQNPVADPAETTTYHVEVFDGFNYMMGSTEVVVSAEPAVNLGPDVLVCPFDTVQISVDFPGMTYYWSNGTVGNSVTVGSTGIGFDVKQIWVEVENADGCVGVDTVLITFDFSQCFGVDELEDGAAFLLYPNPTSGQLHFHWKGIAGAAEMSIIDMHGRTVYQGQFNSSDLGEYTGMADISQNPQGIYQVRLVSKDRVMVRKVVLK